VNIEPATCAILAKHPMIRAIKEASGNISKIVEIAALVGDDLDIYSGNDDQIVPIMACGGLGVISVLSNVLPGETSAMCHKMLEGDVKGAMEMQKKYLPLVNALFSQVNPIPAKAAMAAMGFCENMLRLPLVPMEEAPETVLLQCMRDALQNDHLKIQLTLKHYAPDQMAFTAEDIYKQMAKNNPALAMMKEKLQLQLD
jgi:4-hydroxy-tetrahydrodipicolinate synthase